MGILTKRHNPILWQEALHQRRTATSSTRLIQGIAAVCAISMIGVATYVLIEGDAYTAMQIAIFVVWLIQIFTALRSITAGTNAISREHVGQTWDALVLTGVGTGKILLGKWRAVLRSLRGWMLVLGAVRLAMLPIFSIGLIKVYAAVTARYSSYTTSNSNYATYGRGLPENHMELVGWAVATAVLLSVAFTLLDVLGSSALGLAASSLMRRSTPAAIVAICVRFAPVVIFSAFLRYQLGVTYFWRWWGRTEFSLADAGTSAMMVLALPLIPWTEGDHAASLPGIVLAGGMLVVLMIVSLGVTWWALRRAGALATKRATGN